MSFVKHMNRLLEEFYTYINSQGYIFLYILIDDILHLTWHVETQKKVCRKFVIGKYIP